MDLIKQYIVQSIAAASNNLRLNTQKIEVVALLREAIVKSDNLEDDIKNMKKITEISTLAIRLNDIYGFLTHGQVDLFKLSEKFKEHSQYLINDLSHMLDMVSPVTFKEALDKLNSQKKEKTAESEVHVYKTANGISVDLSGRKPDPDAFEKPESEVIKEEFIFEEEKNDEDLFFQNYETEILKPIRPLDTMLKDLADNDINPDELNKFSRIMSDNGEMSVKIGFEIIANMHRIISKSLLLIKTRELMPGREVIEAMRACLIVIVAVVKGKEVDITNYLNRAEEFGRKIKSLKVKEIN